MKKLLIFVLIVGVVGAILYSVLRWTSPELAKQLAFYAIGLGAFAVGIFKKILSFFGSDRALNRAEARNDEIKAELERIKKEVARANEQFEAQREANRSEIERLEGRLAEQREQVEATGAERKRVREMDVDEYLESLSSDERRTIEAEMMEGIIDSSTLQ